MSVLFLGVLDFDKLCKGTAVVTPAVTANAALVVHQTVHLLAALAAHAFCICVPFLGIVYFGKLRKRTAVRAPAASANAALVIRQTVHLLAAPDAHALCPFVGPDSAQEGLRALERMSYGMDLVLDRGGSDTGAARRLHVGLQAKHAVPVDPSHPDSVEPRLARGTSHFRAIVLSELGEVESARVDARDSSLKTACLASHAADKRSHPVRQLYRLGLLD